MIVVDEERFVAAVRARAAAEPDKKYTAPMATHINDFGEEEECGGECVYVEPNEVGDLVGSCLIGCGLLDSGVPAEKLDVGEFGLVSFAKKYELTLSPFALAWAANVQHHQDNGIPWGRAVEMADEEIPGVK